MSQLVESGETTASAMLSLLYAEKPPEKKPIPMSKISIFAIACATSLVAVMTCAGQTWDAHNDFSITNNPNGQWTYGWSTTLTSALNLCTRHSTDAGTGVQAWDDPTNSFLGAPDVANNPSNNQAGLLPPN